MKQMATPNRPDERGQICLDKCQQFYSWNRLRRPLIAAGLGGNSMLIIYQENNLKGLIKNPGYSKC